MSSSPLPAWALTDVQPAKEQYLELLRHEAQRRGLINWSEAAPSLDDLTAAHPFDQSSQRHSLPQTPEEWCTDISAAAFSPTLLDLHTEAARETVEEEASDRRRAELLEEHAPLCLLQVTKDVHSALHIHGASALLAHIEKQHPHNTILHSYAALLKLQENQPTSSSTQIPIYIYSDLPALPPSTLHPCLIPSTTTFPTFLAWSATLPLIRHFVTQHSPALAASLFVPDTLLHPLGEAQLASIGHLMNPHPSTRTYDDGPGRGWHSQVFPRPDPRTPFTKELPARDWRVLDTAADWDSLRALLLQRDRTLTVALLHQSVRERCAYVSERVAKEEARAREFDTDLRPFNVFREEDRERVDWEDASLLGPKREMETQDEEEARDKRAVEGSVAMMEVREIVAWKGQLW